MSSEQVELIKLMLKTERNLIGIANDRLDDDVQDLLDALTAAEFVDANMVVDALRDIAGIETEWNRELKEVLALHHHLAESVPPGPDVLDDLVDDVELQQQLLAFAMSVADDGRSGPTPETPPD